MTVPGARVAYWELFVDRRLCTEGGSAEELTAESTRLSEDARTWFYRGIRVWRIRP